MVREFLISPKKLAEPIWRRSSPKSSLRDRALRDDQVFHNGLDPANAP